MAKNKKRYYFTLGFIIFISISFFIMSILNKGNYIYNALYFLTIKGKFILAVVNCLFINFIDRAFKIKILSKYEGVSCKLFKPTLKGRNINLRKNEFFELTIFIPVLIIVIESFMHSFLRYMNTCYSFILVTILLAVITRIEDVIIILKSVDPIVTYIEFNDQGKKTLIKETKIKIQHIRINLLYKDYKDYSLEELKMEKIFLDTKIFKYSNKKFFDTYILPILMIMLSSTPPILSLCLGTYCNYIGKMNINLLIKELRNVAIFYYKCLGIIAFCTIFIIIMCRTLMDYSDISKIKLREYVVDDLISKNTNRAKE